MNKIRVLRIQSRICVGGPALNSILLSAGLDPDRFETVLVGGRLDPGEKSMAPFAEEKGVTIHEVAEMGRSINALDDLRALWKLIGLIRSYKPQVVHTHTAKAGAVGRLAAFLCGVPVRVHTFHGHVFQGYFPAWKTAIFIWIERVLALMSTRIIAISERQRLDLTEVYKVVSPKKCTIVRLGFELGKIAGGSPGKFRQRMGLPQGPRLAGILARLVPIKNHALLLDGIAQWRRLQPEATPDQIRFLIIGDGELRADLEQQAADLGIKPFLVFAGWQGDVPEIYADLDLNLLTSKNEGTPVTLIEGLSVGVPILATDVGGIRDFAGDEHGTILPADASPEDLGRALHKILANPGDLQRLPDEAREGIRQGFDVKRLVGDVERLYDEALHAKGLLHHKP